jgi:ABC-2 type transport system ATP-binding protein
MRGEESNPMTESSDDPIVVRQLSRRFGTNQALDDLSLTVARGVVFGLVGENGSGKTTLIKHILGLFKPQTGSVRVFGKDPVGDPVGVLSRVGYLSEERDLPGWMRIDELMRYTKAFYPSWDDRFAEEIRESFQLDPRAKVKTLSMGQRARAGLLVALAYRPQLLVLDEPSTGLDPIVRRDILGAIIRTIADEGRTVLFSSHLLDEVERVCDHVAMIDAGKIALCGPLDEIRQSHHIVTVRFDEPRTVAPPILGALSWDGDGREWTAVVAGGTESFASAASDLGGRIVERRVPSLDSLFVARAGRLHPQRAKVEV